MQKYKKIDFNIEDLQSLSNSDLKKVADYWLRQYLLRNRQKQNGSYLCPLKKRWYTSDKIQVAHYIDRSIIGLRYNLINCHLISKQSNEWDSKVPKEGYKSLHHYDYEIYIRSTYGDNVLEDLLEKSKEVKVFYKEDYIEIINNFRNA